MSQSKHLPPALQLQLDAFNKRFAYMLQEVDYLILVSQIITHRKGLPDLAQATVMANAATKVDPKTVAFCNELLKQLRQHIANEQPAENKQNEQTNPEQNK